MAVYFVSYLTRVNYGAVISEIVAAEGIKKSLASLALTGSAVTYGLGQLLSGYMGDKIEPKRFISCGLIVTVTLNLLLSLCRSVYPMIVIWSINGLAQACMWPPLVRLMTALLSQTDYQRTCITVSWGGSFGTIAVYLISPVMIHGFGWRSVFILSAFMAAIMLVIWIFRCPDIENEATGKAEFVENRTEKKSGLPPIIWVIMLSIAFEGMLRDGVTTWMPSLISENFNLSSSVSIFSSVVLPLFSIFAYKITQIIYEKTNGSAVFFSGILFLSAVANGFVMSLTFRNNLVISIAASALLVGAMHGISLLMTCMVPPFFKKYGKVAFVSGLLNACTYVGSAASTYGIAAFSENFGWKNTIYTWCLCALLGALMCLSVSAKWKKFTHL